MKCPKCERDCKCKDIIQIRTTETTCENGTISQGFYLCKKCEFQFAMILGVRLK